jgi:hypothetical protein
MIYSLTIHRLDKRCKTGKRFFGIYEFDRPNDQAMEREIKELARLYPKNQFVIEFDEKYKTVKNLMTGKDVVIDKNTPRCCDPSSEAYWSM